MASTTVRIDRQSYATLQQLARSAGESMQGILERAIKDYETKCFWEQTDAAYRALRSDATAWQEETEDRRLWEATLMDDLDKDEMWNEHKDALP